MAEQQPVLCRGRDRANGRERRKAQRHEIRDALEPTDMREPRVERHDEQEGEQDLNARDYDAQLAR